MELWNQIRRRILVEGESKRSIQREFGLHWDTLQKILTYPEPPRYRMSKRRRKRVLEPFLPIIDQILNADRQVRRKQRHTAQRLFQRLRDEYDYAGGITVVKEAVRAWHRGQAEVFVPLSHPPGEAQVDFGEADVLLDGQLVTVALFVMTLPYSGALFCCVFARECTEAFLEGHRRAFEFFGGVPYRNSYDNTRIAVKRVLCGRQRELTDAFLRLQSHYLFKHHFCRVGRPNEKGHVENLLGFGRRNFLVPLPQLVGPDALENLNAKLEADCRVDLQRQVRGKPASKAELLQQERVHFNPLPAEAFQARRVETPKVNSLSLVRFDRNDYSVPTAYAHHQVTVVGGIEQVKILFAEQVVAVHRRDWGKHQVHFNPVHYLALLERKPGAFDFARPLEGWKLPECLGVLRRRLESQWQAQGTRRFIGVLRLLERFSLRQLARAVAYALSIDVIDADAIRLILEHRQDRPVGLFCLDGRPPLQGVQVQPPDLLGYRSLLRGGVV